MMSEFFKNLLFGPHVLGMIFLVGLKLSLKSGFLQIRKAGSWFREAVCPQRGDKKEESGFGAMLAALGGSIGTGNIVGVAAAVSVGGAGAVFWMWATSVLGMATVFFENYLSVRHRRAPGAIGYIKEAGKPGPLLAELYAAGCVAASLAMGNMAQMNAVAEGLESFGANRIATGAVFAAVIFFVAKKGMKAVIRIAGVLVPAMSLIFFAAALCVLFVNGERLGDALAGIFTEAFSLRAGAGGTVGVLIAAREGAARGIFTNEAGLGSSSFAYDGVRGKTPVQIGFLGIFQVFADTIVMCTVTALCILSAPQSGLEGAKLTFFAFSSALGEWGGRAVSLCTVLFGFATVVTWSGYGRVSFMWLLGKRAQRRLFALIFAGAMAVCAFLGAFLPLDTLLNIGDAANGLMAIPNVLALFWFCREMPRLRRGGDSGMK